jgi:hypothetical protein
VTEWITVVNDVVAPKHTRIEGTAEYEAALDALIARAARRLRLFDGALKRGFDTPHRHDLLRTFLLASRMNRLQIVLHDVDDLTRDCPRLLSLMRSRGDAISIHQTLPEAHGIHDPFAVADERDFLHRFHYADPRSLLALDDPHGARQFAERFEEMLGASVPAVPSTTLGL